MLQKDNIFLYNQSVFEINLNLKTDVFNLIFTICNGWEPIRHGSTKAHFLRSSKKPNSRRDGWVCLTNSERDECSGVDNVVDVDYSGVN